MNEVEAFTIRVYGLLISEESLLLSQENIFGSIYTKLPGGGLEFGEGTIECVQREFEEEANLNISVEKHFYTTEDFVASAFNSQMQVMSIYYLVSCKDLSPLLHLPKSDFKKHGDQKLYWKKLSDLSTEDVDLSIDKIVVEKLLSK
ncbi:MAG: ADP-ribose pyrophosphatase YjhB (NUDIX family) [Roseivirga sp.]|jgi:ADP-ribose pyrophosphatase YjhB (NUDIX family)